MNITLSYECNSQGIDHFSKYSKMDKCCSLERQSVKVVPIIMGLSLLNEKDKKCLVSLENPTQISYLLYLALFLKIVGDGDFMKFSSF